MIHRRSCNHDVADGSVVALAVTLGTKLVTMDAKVLKAFPRHAVPLQGR